MFKGRNNTAVWLKLPKRPSLMPTQVNCCLLTWLALQDTVVYRVSRPRASKLCLYNILMHVVDRRSSGFIHPEWQRYALRWYHQFEKRSKWILINFLYNTTTRYSTNNEPQNLHLVALVPSIGGGRNAASANKHQNSVRSMILILRGWRLHKIKQTVHNAALL